MSKVLRHLNLTARSLSMRAAVLLLAFAALSGSAGRASAQWTTSPTLQTFTISDITFLDAQGLGNWGFIGGDIGGANGNISYTTDAGTTWNIAGVPPFVGYITDFAFTANPTVGFASIRGNGTGVGPTFSGILQTSDTGKTWKLLSTAPHEVNGLYFNKISHCLFAATQSEGGQVSCDSGKSWAPFEKDSSTIWTGFAFIGGVGIMCSGQCPIDFSLQQLPWWDRTLDGGKTWHRLSDPLGCHMYISSWQPVGLPGTTTFMATSDCDGSVYRSDDNGFSFATASGPVNTGNINGSTGSMAGDACSIFQSNSLNNAGVYFSTTDGAQWLSIPQCNSPVRTRFYVSPTLVWAFQGKAIMNAPRPTDVAIHILPSMHIDFANAKCQDNDTMIRLMGCAACSPTTTINDTIGWTPGSTQRNFSVVGLSSHPFCGIDSVLVRYHPSSAIPDTAFIHLQFTTNGVTVDTAVMVTGPGSAPRLFIATKRAVTFHAACTPIDTQAIFIANNSCGNMTVTVGSQVGNNVEIQETDLPNPIFMPPGTPVQLNFHLNGTAKGTYNLTVTLHITAPGGVSYDTVVTVTLIINTTAEPLIRSITKTYNSQCDIHDSLIVFGNNLCDTVTFPSPPLLSNITDYTIIWPPGTTWPHKLAPGETIIGTVRFNRQKAGNYPGKITWSYFVGHDTITADRLDTTQDLSYKITNDLAITGVVTPGSFNFGGVANCTCGDSIKMTVTNRICVPITIASILPIGFPANNSVTFGSGGLHVGETLQPGESDYIMVQYCASKDVPYNSAEKMAVNVTYYNGTDSTVGKYAVVASPVAKVTTHITQSILDFGTRHIGCDGPDTLSEWLVNSPCSIASIYDIRNVPPGFTVISPTLPTPHQQIQPGDSVKVIVVYNPQPGQVSPISSTFTIETRDVTENQQGSTNDIVVNGQYVLPVRNVTAATVPSDPMKVCVQRDTPITINNNGTCDLVTISGITFSDPHVYFTPGVAPTFPVTITAGNSFTFSARFDPTFAPALTTGPLAGNITAAASPDIVMPFSVVLQSCGTPTVTPHVQNTNFTGSNCTPVSQTYTVTATDKTDITVTLTGGGTVFTATVANGVNTGTLGTPMTVNPGETLTIVVTFQDANKTDNATLNITSTTIPFNQSYTLTGTASGTPATAQVCVRLQGGAATASLAPDGKTTQVLELYLIDLVPAGASTLTVPVNFNNNMLTPTMSAVSSVWVPSGNPTPQGDGPTFSDTYTFTNSSKAAVGAGEVIGHITVVSSLAAQTSTSITVSNPKFDANAEVCTVAAAAGTCAPTITVPMSCSDSIIVVNFNGKLDSLSGTFKIIPNPAGMGGSDANVHFTTHLDGDVTVDILDLSGSSVETLTSANPTHGEYTLPIPTSRLSEGTYFARVRVGRTTLVKKFMVQKN